MDADIAARAHSRTYAQRTLPIGVYQKDTNYIVFSSWFSTEVCDKTGVEVPMGA